MKDYLGVRVLKNVVSNTLQIILFVNVYAFCFFILRYLVSGGLLKVIRNKIDNFKNINLKRLKTIKNKGLFEKLDLLIEKSGLTKSSYFWFINAFSTLIACFIIMIFSFIYFYNFFGIISAAFLISIPAALSPIIIIYFLVSKNEIEIEKVLSNFLIQLKNNTHINNDIVAAFKMTETTAPKPLNSYIHSMLAKINSGIRVEDALDEFANKINIKKVKFLIKNIKYCYIYGGSFTELLDKTQKLIFDIEQEKNKRVQETRSARYILIILIAIDLYMYISFINNKPEYLQILTKTFVGQVLLNINFLSIWVVLWLSYWVKKLDY